ncbi:hypothetical protein QAD02_012573 [Eretmocerus hayati]|uniref:Uncharacterized protein n=1 Tax=Eretmocerus hayati TaxID=131215 RepID=A0ACC2P146_9HYME|nr:hypothetical protein QAD02_012573 [Eretmocerus hayati]
MAQDQPPEIDHSDEVMTLGNNTPDAQSEDEDIESQARGTDLPSENSETGCSLDSMRQTSDENTPNPMRIPDNDLEERENNNPGRFSEYDELLDEINGMISASDDLPADLIVEADNFHEEEETLEDIGRQILGDKLEDLADGDLGESDIDISSASLQPSQNEGDLQIENGVSCSEELETCYVANICSGCNEPLALVRDGETTSFEGLCGVCEDNIEELLFEDIQDEVVHGYKKIGGSEPVGASTDERETLSISNAEQTESSMEMGMTSNRLKVAENNRAGKLERPNYNEKRPKAPKRDKPSHRGEAETGNMPSTEEDLHPGIIEQAISNLDTPGEGPGFDNDNFGTVDTGDHDLPEMEPNQMQELPAEQNSVDDAHERTDTHPSDKRVVGKIFVESREKLFMRKDNYMYFVSTVGEPCDNGSKDLKDRGELPKFPHLEVGGITMVRHSNKLHLIVPIRGPDKEGLTVIDSNITMGFKNLKNVIEKEQLRSISVAESIRVENILWSDIMIKLRNILKGVDVKIIICKGIVRYPKVEERSKPHKKGRVEIIFGTLPKTKATRPHYFQSHCTRKSKMDISRMNLSLMDIYYAEISEMITSGSLDINGVENAVYLNPTKRLQLMVEAVHYDHKDIFENILDISYDMDEDYIAIITRLCTTLSRSDYIELVMEATKDQYQSWNGDNILGFLNRYDVLDLNNGEPPLITGVVSGSQYAVTHMIRQGYDINIADDNGRTPLTAAIEHLDVEMVRLLLKEGADPNGVGGDQLQTPIIQALRAICIEIVDLLIDYKCDLRRPSQLGHYPIHYVLTMRELDREALLKKM